MNREQLNVRVPAFTLEQIDLLIETYGLTKTQVVLLAIDRLTSDLNPETGKPSAIRRAEEMVKAGE